MPTLKTYDLFISHAWKYGEDYRRVVNLLDSASNFHYRNYSAPEDNPLHIDGKEVRNSNEIEHAIIRKIMPVNCVLIISGMYYNTRKWMQFIAIRPWGAVRMPTEVQNAADKTVSWNTSSIVDAIRCYSI